MFEFKEFGKIPRLKREICITEKIDGTNACVVITNDLQIGAQSRNRIITPDDDNFGFAQWVNDNREDLLKMGEGYHYGEWYGRGIGRNYDLPERRFALFNAHRWNSNNPNKPTCAGVVPMVGEGWTDWQGVDRALAQLRDKGSVAVPGFMNPEGIIVYHAASRMYFKVTLDNDGVPKSKAIAKTG